MSFKFSNHVAVVTGGSSGIGFSIAQALILQGVKRVYITGRSAGSLKEATARLGEAAVAVVSDVSSPSDLKKLKDEIERRGDRLDCVFANAGICEKNEIGKTKEIEFDRTFDINVKGVFFTVQTLLPLVKDGASLVLTASICANSGMERLSLYNASKAAVRSFARSWANDLRDRKIRVNALSPGFTFTSLFENGLRMSVGEIEALKEDVGGKVPLGYMAEPAEIASAALFLASNDGRYVNGIEMTVDGGVSQI